MVVNHYLHGAAYPTGGAAELARRIIPTVVREGGAVFVNAPVRSIIVDELGSAAVRLTYCLTICTRDLLQCVYAVCGAFCQGVVVQMNAQETAVRKSIFTLLHVECIFILALCCTRWSLARQ